MIKSKIGVSPPRQSPKKKPSREASTDKIQIKINEYESHLQKIRDDIFKLQVELFQISSPAKKAIVKPILQSIEKVNQDYELILKKYDLSQSLVQTFQSIIDIYPIDQTKVKKANVNKPLLSASSNVVKPHIKNYADFSKNTPFERAQKTQRVGDSRNQLKKKIEIYQSHQLLKTYTPPEEKEIRSKRDFITLLEKDLVDLKKANDHLIRRFGTNSGFRVSSQIKYGQKINQTLKDNLHDFQKEYGYLSDQIRQYQSQINSLQEDPPHYARLIDEGKKYKEQSNQRVNDLLQEASDRVKFGQKILASIEQIASLLDQNHLSSGIAITELQWIMEKLSVLLNKNITSSPIKAYDSIWDLTKTSTLKVFDDENSSNLNNSTENGDNFPEIPEIPIMTMFPMDQSLGNTRQTRRLFSALNSLRSGNDNDRNVNQSMDTLGIILGNVFVDRFSPLFHSYDTKLTILQPEKVFMPKPLTKTIDLTSLLNLYNKYKPDLNLTQLENEEIQQFDPDFLSFSSEKAFFKENLTFSSDEFVDFIINSITSTIKTPKTPKTEKFTTPKKVTSHSSNFDSGFLIPCLWISHDFATDEEIPYLIQKLTPIFNKRKKSFVISNPSEIVAWAAMISSFFSCHSRPVKEALLTLYDPIFPVLLDKYLPMENDNPQTKCTTLALLRYGRHHPREFINFINLKNNATSFIHNFIHMNYKMKTFVCAGIEFAKSSLFLLKEESLTWHTSLFYHYLVNELMPVRIRIEIVKSFLSIMCSIVENRDYSMTLLLKRIYFIYFLKKNFELEEIVCERQDGPQESVQNISINLPQTTAATAAVSNGNDYSYEEEEEEFERSDFESNPLKINDDKDKMPYVPPIPLNFSIGQSSSKAFVNPALDSSINASLSIDLSKLKKQSPMGSILSNKAKSDDNNDKAEIDNNNESANADDSNNNNTGSYSSNIKLNGENNSNASNDDKSNSYNTGSFSGGINLDNENSSKAKSADDNNSHKLDNESNNSNDNTDSYSNNKLNNESNNNNNNTDSYSNNKLDNENNNDNNNADSYSNNKLNNESNNNNNTDSYSSIKLDNENNSDDNKAKNVDNNSNADSYSNIKLNSCANENESINGKLSINLNSHLSNSQSSNIKLSSIDSNDSGYDNSSYFYSTAANSFLTSNSNGKLFSTSNNDEDSPLQAPIIPPISFSKMSDSKPSMTKINISYNDLSSVTPIPSFNLDNPKLQLHFQVNDNKAPVRSSVSFSNSDYMSQRSMYPIYLDIDVHSLFVKTMFATLVDHSLNRFDVFFCDPFPFVNRKPNILFTLMQHMESSANTELKDFLNEHSKSIIDNSVSKDIPPIPPIDVHSAVSSMQKREKSENETIEDFNEPQIKRSLLPPVSPGNKNISLNLVPLKVGISAPKFFDQSSLLFDTKGINNNNVGEFLSFDNLGHHDGLYSRNEYKYLLMIKKKKAQANILIAKRLMRLTMPCLFNKDNYVNGRHIASGAFGSVMVVRQAETQKYLAVKILKKSKNEYDNPHLFEVFTEVSILEMCQSDRRVTQLNDYGCTSNSYYIIMEYYPTTLKAWRRKNVNPEINVLLRLYREFLNSCTVLQDKHINHYDIKCDNVMVDDSGHPCLADFGESMCYTTDKNCFTMLNKGTEWIKSPEMLSIALNSTITNPNFDRRKKVGAGPESDVWSIGCLFYELITNWSHFFRRITENDQILILPENKMKLPEDPRFGAFLEFVLQRNIRSRPNLNQVISKFDEMFPEANNSPLPKIEIPTFE